MDVNPEYDMDYYSFILFIPKWKKIYIYDHTGYSNKGKLGTHQRFVWYWVLSLTIISSDSVVSMTNNYLLIMTDVKLIFF